MHDAYLPFTQLAFAGSLSYSQLVTVLTLYKSFYKRLLNFEHNSLLCMCVYYEVIAYFIPKPGKMTTNIQLIELTKSCLRHMCRNPKSAYWNGNLCLCSRTLLKPTVVFWVVSTGAMTTVNCYSILLYVLLKHPCALNFACTCARDAPCVLKSAFALNSACLILDVKEALK